MLSFGVRIILLLLIIGGAIAIIGDYIGRQIGRKRLTIFNLRPRHSAFAITIFTGILIVFITFGIMLAVSQDARTALFGLEELRKDVAEKSRLLRTTKDELALRIAEREQIDKKLTASKVDLRQARREILALEKTKEKLGKEVEVSRKGTVLFKVGEVLLSSIIQAGPEKDKLAAGLRHILSAADTHVRSFGIEGEKHLIFISPEEFDRAAAILQKRRGENIVKIIALRNTVFGEEVPVRFKIIENRKIYKSGQEIAKFDIPHGLSVPEIELEVKRLLYIANQSAKEAGVSPDPSGSMGSVSYSRIFSLAKKIKAYRKGIRLKAFAKTDIYSIGPLELKFKIHYQ